MNYGYFDHSKREYVITNPKTPVKWINYIGTLSFGGFIDATGGSLLCKDDPSYNRIINYDYQKPLYEFNGETMYIRLKLNNNITIFSPFYVPTLESYEFYECRVGTGYSKYTSIFYGIKTEVLVFIPLKGNREIREITITNLNKEAAEIDVIPVASYTHFDALKQLTNLDWVPQTMMSKAYYVDKHCILTQFAYMNKDSKVNYLTTNHEVTSFESDREKFLGDSGYGTYKNPKSLLNYELSSYEAKRGNNIGALMNHMGTLKSGEKTSLIIELGQCQNIKDEENSILEYFKEEKVHEAFHELICFWNSYLNKLQVKTPDSSMNSMINIYNPRQCYITKNFSRYLSLYQTGYGERGIGIRDLSQDLMGILPSASAEVKESLKTLLTYQLNEGFSMHEYNPFTRKGSIGDSKERDDRPHYYSDDHLFIILSLLEYLKETGDLNFLKEDLPFYDKDTGSVLCHIEKALDFSSRDLGSHGLSLLGFADWNDTVNLEKGAESVFTTMLFGTVLKECIPLMKLINREDLEEKYIIIYENLKASVEKYCYDGKWFIRYFDSNKKPLGSHINEEGKIYVNSQSFAVISGLCQRELCETALDSVNKLLYTKNGIKSSVPSFHGYNKDKGGITTYPPGAKENGGIFLHTNPWVIIAETMLGHGDRAFMYYSAINPASKNDKILEYECEPYCYAQNILGDEHPQFGLGRNSWLSGTASWSYQAAVKYILGIRPSLEGLVIDPCVPHDFNEFTVERHIRNCSYEIKIYNPEGVEKGIKEVFVDHKTFNKNVIPYFNDNMKHQVKIIMG